MKGRLTIRHLEGSTLAGLEQSFSGPVVRLGTGAAAHVAFDPDEDSAVAAAHAELEIGESCVRVRALQTEHRTYVNDALIDGPTEIQPDDVVMLGEAGPQFTVSVVDFARGVTASRPDRDQVRPVRKPPLATMAAPRPVSPPDQTEKKQPAPTVIGQRRPVIPPGELPPVRPGLGGGVTPPPVTPPMDMDARAPGIQNLPRGGGKTLQERRGKQGGVGINTLMGVVNRVTQEERTRTVKLLSITVGAFAVVGLVATIMLWPDREFDWATVTEELRPSVCLVMSRPPGEVGRERGFGTAWSVGRGVFATNSHVAEVFNEKVNGIQQDILLRTPGGEPVDMRVTSIKLHPAYTQWQELLKKYNPYIPGSSKFLNANVFAACDVALMYIDEADIPKQPPAFALATDADIGDLGLGSMIATLGYPQEGKKTNGSKPEPEANFGELSKSGNFFLGSAPPRDADMFWYNWNTAGGASGSPVFNREGEVISLLAAAEFVKPSAHSPRIPVGGASVGPHVRFLRELLEGKADEIQLSRGLFWQEQLGRMFVEGATAYDQLSERNAAYILERENLFNPEKQRLQLLHQETATMTVRNGQGRYRFANLPSKRGVNWITVGPIDRPTRVWAAIEPTSSKRPAKEKLSYPVWSDWRNMNGGRFSVVVETAPESEDGSTEVAIFVYCPVSK